ncbi:PQQ-binding-like beta-propeller repeat protein [Candidatus Poribacteria bacterium]|nr:PQQ-binding-like beta-propeller repeat protein [Candidatus Poribacteria bacterium]
MSAPTVANGKIFVSEIDSHSVVALDCETGKVLWRFLCGGRVDSPPTVS